MRKAVCPMGETLGRWAGAKGIGGMGARMEGWDGWAAVKKKVWGGWLLSFFRAIGPRVTLRARHAAQNTYLKEDDANNEPYKESRGCFGF